MFTFISQEKPKEKTVFNVKLESFDAAAKPKIIREVKAMVPNLTLIDVRVRSASSIQPLNLRSCVTGQEVRRVSTKSPERESRKGGRGEAQEDVHRPRRCHRARVDTSHGLLTGLIVLLAIQL